MRMLNMAVNLKSAGGADVKNCRSATSEASATSDFLQGDILFAQVNILLPNILKPLSGLSSALMTLITVNTLIQFITLTPPALCVRKGCEY